MPANIPAPDASAPPPITLKRCLLSIVGILHAIHDCRRAHASHCREALGRGTDRVAVPSKYYIRSNGGGQAMFYLYAALGLIGALFYSRLPRAEVKGTVHQATALVPSRRTVYKLAALFSLDS